MVQDLWGESPHGGTMEASNNREGGATFAFNVLAYQGDPDL
jgi:K+-sensing histidine kinase KdpD